MKKIDLVKLVEEVDKEEMIEGGVHKIFALTCLYKFIEMQEEAINYTHSCKSDSEQLVCNYCLEKTNTLPDDFGCQSCIDNYK